MDSRDLFKNTKKYLGKEVTLKGWIRNHRKQKEFGFIEFSDGMSFKHIQIVYESHLKDFDEIQKLHNGSSIEVTGKVVESQGKQDFEVNASEIKLLGDCPEDYPIQPKPHSREL